MDIKKILDEESKLPKGPDNQKSQPQFLEMLDALTLIQKRLDDTLENKKHISKNRDYQLDEKEQRLVIEDVFTSMLKDKNPFLKKAKDDEELEKDGAIDLIIKNSERGYFKIPQEMFDEKQDDKSIEEQAKEAATDDKAFENMKNANDEFKANNEELFYTTIINILKNAGQGNTPPCPTKYYWACEQLVRAENLIYRVDETYERQQVWFNVQFPGQKEIPIKSVCFKQQYNDIAPIDAHDFKDLHTIETGKQAERGRDIDTSTTSFTEIPPTEKDKDGKPITKPPKQIEERRVDKFNRMNNDPSSLFYEVKQKLGYKMDEIAPTDWKTMNNDREMIGQVIFMLRNTPNFEQDKIQSIQQEKQLETELTKK